MRNWLPMHGYQSYKRVTRTGVFHASPPMVLAGGFLALIVIGTLLLLLPIAAPQPLSVFEALFTATSSVTVTGMMVIDLGSRLSYFGQSVVMVLVQVGGLGFVTFAVVAALTLGKKISLKQQALVLEAFNQTSVSKVTKTAFAVIKIAIAIEFIGLFILTLWWWREASFLDALYSALFHTVSAFNNAGISLYDDNLARYVDDPVTILTITLMVILGGIGFTVLTDIGRTRGWARLRPYTKLILMGTLALNLLGFAIIWALESHNPNTLAPLSLKGQALAAWLQTVATRTAGFSSVDISLLSDPAALIMMLLMFIGGGSLSTASGIKLGTFIVLLAAAHSYIFQRSEVVLLKRSVSSETVQKSLALLLVTLGMGFIATVLISIFENLPLINIMFDVVAALSTTGLGRNLAPHLTTPSQAILMLLMFMGRVGPLTLVYSIATQRRSRIRYPETEMQVG